ncbi:GTPase activating protein (GAP) for Rho1p [Mucor velutinosus]|uniref:GTPase activating protein (GAP) for Rho1p n=1 Tax=Mucor velutinosus TaxID=708070 RepID=A0AAN7D455_9FUNG|nr:GTPase activating protein (GAP) for Rho1p [Mucor velutinosus]
MTTTTSADAAANETINNPFVNTPTEGDDTNISAQDTLKLLESLKLDSTTNTEIQALLTRAKNGEAIEREVVMNTVASLLSADSEHLGELTGSIGDFDIQFR